MDSVAFRAWLNGIRGLNTAQRGQAMRELALAEAGISSHDDDRASGAASTPDAARVAPPAGDKTSGGAAAKPNLMTRIGQSRLASIGCPHSDSDDIRPWGTAGGKPRYRCAACRKTFNPLTGTPLSGLHYPDRWQDQAQALINGETIAKAAARCGVDYTTAFRWRHRFLKALTLDKPTSLSGVVEADETFILESFKGKRRGLPRAPRKRGGKASKRGLSAESKFPSSWHGTVRARPSMGSCRVWMRPASPRFLVRSSRSQHNSAVTAGPPSRHSRAARGWRSMFCRRQAFPGRRRPICISITSMPTMAV